jgi:Zn-dependent protease
VKPHVSIFGIPVRFDPSYLFLILILGYFLYARGNVALLVAWVPVVTIAILMHELGHAVAGRIFGLKPSIVLYGMGGLTQFPAREHHQLSHARRMFIAAAGPLVGIAIGLVLSGVLLFRPDLDKTTAGDILDMAVFTTLGWGILNLIPMLPLDGGHLLALALDKMFGPRGVLFARIFSMALAVPLAALAIWGEMWFSLFILASLVLTNWRAYRLEKNWQQEGPLEDAIKQAYAALEAGDAVRARRIAEAVQERAISPKTKGHAAHLLAWTHLLEGDAEAAHRALASAPADHPPDAFLEGSIALARGDASRAIAPLIESLVDRSEDEVADALAKALAGAGRIDEMVGLLESPPRSERAGKPAIERVAHGLFTAGSHDLARELYARIFDRFGDPIDAFNAACAAAREGHAARAIAFVDKAIDAGLSDRSLIDTDEDLAALKGTPEFDALRRRAGLA